MPGFASLDFGADKIDAMVDLACRFDVKLPSAPCTLDRHGNDATLSSLPTNGRQYCLVVRLVEQFPVGETVLLGRVADGAGNPGPPRSIVIRVQN